MIFDYEIFSYIVTSWLRIMTLVFDILHTSPSVAHIVYEHILVFRMWLRMNLFHKFISNKYFRILRALFVDVDIFENFWNKNLPKLCHLKIFNNYFVSVAKFAFFSNRNIKKGIKCDGLYIRSRYFQWKMIS